MLVLKREKIGTYFFDNSLLENIASLRQYNAEVYLQDVIAEQSSRKNCI